MKATLRKIQGNLRMLFARWALRFLRDGEYTLPFPIYHTTLQPACSATYMEDVQRFGAPVAERWAKDGCGIASIRMAITSLLRNHNSQQSLPSVAAMSETGSAEGGYTETHGWIHRYLVRLAQKYGFHAESRVFEKHLALCYNLMKGRIPIVSVTNKFLGGEPREDGQLRAKGGHLVVIRGFEWQKGRCVRFIINDPQNPHLLDDKVSDEAVDIGFFLRSYAEKVIYVY